MPLEVVGHIIVPDSVARHRFVREALGCATLLERKNTAGEAQHGEQVVGTANTGEVELYGWAPMVEAHVDNTGLVYLVALNDGQTMLEVLDGEEAYSVRLAKGMVLRLNDFARHWTTDTGVRVCAFLGSYPTPCDEWAVAELQRGVDALASGDYYGAPRVRDGFRAYLDDECLVADLEAAVTAPYLLADALAKDLLIEYCAVCDRPAVKIDHHWPYDSSGHRCNGHLTEGM